MESFQEGDVTYFKLKVSCPVCLEQGRQTKQSFWVHEGGCGGDMFVGDNTHYHCKKCKEDKYVNQWEFGCPEHSGGSSYYMKIRPEGSTGSTDIAVGGQMVTATGSKWLIRFLENMREF